MRTYSAWVPSMILPRIQPPLWQWEYMPFLHASHLPHEVMQEMRTRSRALKPETADPTSATTPTPSCPRMRPALTEATSPLRMWRSVPQIVVLVMRTMASVGAWTSGLGFSSQDRLPGPLYTSAFIVASCFGWWIGWADCSVWLASYAVHSPRLALELVAECRVRDGDQRARPFGNGAAMKLGHTEFGNHGLHVGARGDHARSWSQLGHDAREPAVLRGGG